MTDPVSNGPLRRKRLAENAETDSADGPSLTKRRNASRAHQAPKSTKKKRKGNGKKDWAIARPRINGRYVSYEEYAEHHGLDINSTIEAFRPAKAMKCDPSASGQNDASGDDPGAPIPSSNADPGSSDNQENTPFPCDERRRNDSLPAFEEVVHSDPAPSGSPSLAHSLSGTFCSPDVADMNMASSEAAGQGVAQVTHHAQPYASNGLLQPQAPFPLLYAPCPLSHVDPDALLQLPELSKVIASLSRLHWDWLMKRLLHARSLNDASRVIRTVVQKLAPQHPDLSTAITLSAVGLAFLRLAAEPDQPGHDAEHKFSSFMQSFRGPALACQPSLHQAATSTDPLPAPTATPTATQPPAQLQQPHAEPSPQLAPGRVSRTVTPSQTPSRARRVSLKREVTAAKVLAGTLADVKSRPRRRKHHPRHLDRILALRWQAHLVSTGLTRSQASAVVSSVHFGHDAKDSTRPARNTNASWREFEAKGALDPGLCHRPRKRRPSKDPIYSTDFVERAKAKMIELTSDKRNPGLVWRKLQAWINGELLTLLSAIVGAPVAPDARCVRRSEYQVKRYMKFLGYQYMADVKGAYTDGHDRPDVVADRNKFIEQWRALEHRMPWVWEGVINDDEDLPIQVDPASIDVIEERTNGSRRVSAMVYPNLPAGTKYLVPCFQDETTFHANDGARRRWRKKGMFMLMSKSRGAAIMVSGYTCPCHGEVASLRKTLEVGKNKDGYYDGKKFMAHFETVVEEFKKLHPPVRGREVEPLFVFDNAAGHKCFKPDALVASRVALNVGGQQPKMRSTVWYSTDGDGEQVEHRQSLVVEDNSHGPENKGKPKGAMLILQERGLWPAGGLKLVCAKLKSNPDFIPCRQHIQEGRTPPSNNCCARRVLELQPDFANEVSWLEEVCRQHGILLLYTPKFHPELNPIERKWGAAKRFARDNCSYSLTALRAVIPQALDSVRLYLSRRFHEKSLRYMAIYEAVRCSAPLADLICRTYRSHRRVSDTTMEGAIRKAAERNPEQKQALLALLDPEQSQLSHSITLFGAGGDDAGEEEAGEDEDDGDEGWEDAD